MLKNKSSMLHVEKTKATRNLSDSTCRNHFFLRDGSDNGDICSFEMDEAAEEKNKGLCYRHIGERLSSQESAKINDESRFLSSRGVPAPSKERKIRLRLNAPM